MSYPEKRTPNHQQVFSGKKNRTSGQDGRVGRYTLPPHTTKRRTTTNLNTKTTRTARKIKLYGSLTTKKFKKKNIHSE